MLLAGIAIPWLLTISIELPATDTWRTAFVVITLPAILALPTLARIPETSHGRRHTATTESSQLQANWSKLGVMRDARLYLMSVAMLGYVGGFTISSTWIYVYMQEQYGLPAVLVGTIVSLAIFVPSIPGAFLSGWLSDRLRTRAKVGAIGALLAGVTLLLLVFRLPLYFTTLALVFYGAFALFHTPIFSMPAETWSVQVSGTALSIMTSISQVGAAIAPAVTGFLLLRTGDYGLVWILSSAVYFSATTALLLTREKWRPA